MSVVSVEVDSEIKIWSLHNPRLAMYIVRPQIPTLSPIGSKPLVLSSCLEPVTAAAAEYATPISCEKDT